MSAEHHEEQPTKLTYPNETSNTIQLVIYDSDKENQSPDIQQDDITITLAQPDLTGDERNDRGHDTIKGETINSSYEPQILPTDVTPPPPSSDN
jgi:hypothetical protein